MRNNSAAQRVAKANRAGSTSVAASATSATAASGSGVPSDCLGNTLTCLRSICVNGNCDGKGDDVIKNMMVAYDGVSPACPKALAANCSATLPLYINQGVEIIKNEQKNPGSGDKSCQDARNLSALAQACAQKRISLESKGIFNFGLENELKAVCGSGSGGSDEMAVAFSKIGAAGFLNSVGNVLTTLNTRDASQVASDANALASSYASRASAICGGDNMYKASAVAAPQEKTLVQTAVATASQSFGKEFGKSLGVVGAEKLLGGKCDQERGSFATLQACELAAGKILKETGSKYLCHKQEIESVTCYQITGNAPTFPKDSAAKCDASQYLFDTEALCLKAAEVMQAQSYLTKCVNNADKFGCFRLDYELVIAPKEKTPDTMSADRGCSTFKNFANLSACQVVAERIGNDSWQDCGCREEASSFCITCQSRLESAPVNPVGKYSMEIGYICSGIIRDVDKPSIKNIGPVGSPAYETSEQYAKVLQDIGTPGLRITRSRVDLPIAFIYSKNASIIGADGKTIGLNVTDWYDGQWDFQDGQYKYYTKKGQVYYHSITDYASFANIIGPSDYIRIRSQIKSCFAGKDQESVLKNKVDPYYSLTDEDFRAIDVIIKAGEKVAIEQKAVGTALV
jgi:hypothetical protein